MVVRGMVQYEILLLLDPDLPEGRETEIVDRIRAEIERNGGAWESHDAWGQRKLAYEIDHKGDGSYHLLLFECEPETLAEIARVLKITDGVLRHLAVRRIKGSPQLEAPAPEMEQQPAEEIQPEPVLEAEPEPAVEMEPEPEPEIVREDG
jgi:small subunit ribosomal protein S6